MNRPPLISVSEPYLTVPGINNATYAQYLYIPLHSEFSYEPAQQVSIPSFY